MGNRNIVHRRIKEYCTSLKSGILYIIEIRNIVQHRKQEFCTTEKKGILYIAHMIRPQARVSPLMPGRVLAQARVI